MRYFLSKYRFYIIVEAQNCGDKICSIFVAFLAVEWLNTFGHVGATCGFLDSKTPSTRCRRAENAAFIFQLSNRFFKNGQLFLSNFRFSN